MVKVRQRTSDDSEIEDMPKLKKRAVASDDEEPEEAPASETGDDDGEDGDEEYEIEAILDHSLGTFADGEIGYFVRWRGYDSSHDSWVREGDAGNAGELIDAYWKTVGGKRPHGKSGPRKSDTKAKTSAVQKRKSPATMVDDSDEQPPPKRRGRPPKASVSDDDEPVVVSKAARKSKKTTGASASTSAKKAPRHDDEEDEEEPVDAEPQYVSMKKKWRNAPSWDHLVDHIETVERTSDGTLNVFFALKSQQGKEGELCREDSTICKQKMPQMLLEFYEQNLRWKEV